MARLFELLLKEMIEPTSSICVQFDYWDELLCYYAQEFIGSVKDGVIEVVSSKHGEVEEVDI